jgi:hypothetical protein
MKITFTNTTDFFIDGYEPLPAKKVIPDWYKNLTTYNDDKKTYGDGKQTSTIKKCMPVFDAIGAGYIIFSPVDVYVSKKDNFFWYEWVTGDALNFHPVEQAPTHPLSNNQNYPKWMNPWSIKTPKGYSSLFIPPVHRESPFAILEGIVDTDTYTNNVNLPFVMTDSEFEGLIPAGTPIAQVIPFKRDEWQMEFGTEEDIELAMRVKKTIWRKFFNAYKTEFRQEKNYS